MNASETETIIKRILPYLTRRGYSVDKDMTFEEPAKIAGGARTGFIDILVHCARTSPVMVIEAKRDGTRINDVHREQGLNYARAKKCLVTALTNGQEFELYNTNTGKQLLLSGTAINRIPSREDLLNVVVPQLKADANATTVKMPADRSIPFRPGLPLSKLNHLIKQCHNSIRKIEKNEEHAFSDFSKFLFLKLLEEKWDITGEKPPYTFLFYELADTPSAQADRVHTAIDDMIGKIRKSKAYGDVLDDPVRLKRDATYLSIVKKLSAVSFHDCDLDSKGAAFEFFVRATLKGKKLGQYFTPRPLVRLMLELGRWRQILTSLQAGQPFKVLDPACGTGGFLVFAMTSCLTEIDRLESTGKIHKKTAEKLRDRAMNEVFHGIDAHEGVACSAKMNMIIAGDGHTNIRCTDSLNETKLIPLYKDSDGQKVDDGKCHLVLTNPPFGTSEAESLTEESVKSFEIKSKRGQSLFVQKMIDASHAGSLIVTVIDEGVLNTASYASLRKHILTTCRVEFVVCLPEDTFKPNKINIRSSVLVLRRRVADDMDLIDKYPIGFISLDSLGYDGSGNPVRLFDLPKLIEEVCKQEPKEMPDQKTTQGYHWVGFGVSVSEIVADGTRRLDYKYWHPEIRRETEGLRNAKTIKSLNLIETKRGKSPNASEYVSEPEGHAFVLKSGSNISKAGMLIPSGDYIEEALFQEYVAKELVLHDGDVVLASTGDGTLGKCCVYRNSSRPAIPEGHVTVIRVDQTQVYPEYLCDYLRHGFGARQIERLFTGSTGMVELTPEDVDRIVVPPLPHSSVQKQMSDDLRAAETATEHAVQAAGESLRGAIKKFFTNTAK